MKGIWLSVIFIIGSAKLLCGASPGTLLRQADREMSRSKWEKALSLYSEAERSTSSPLTKMTAATGKARALKALGRYGECSKAWESAISAASDADDDGGNLSRLRFNYASFLCEAGNYQLAETQLYMAGALSDSTENFRHRVLLADIYARTGSLDLAIYTLKDAIANNSSSDRDHFLAIQNLGFIYSLKGDHCQAETYLHQACQGLAGADRHIALANLAMAKAAQSRFDEALKDIEESVRYFQRHPDADNYTVSLRKKGEILARASRKTESIRIFREYFKLEKKTLETALPAMTPSQKLDWWTKMKPRLSRCFTVGNADPEFMFEVALYRRQTSMLAMRDSLALSRTLSAGAAEIRKSLPKDGVAVEFILADDMNGTPRYYAAILPKKGNSSFVDILPANFFTDTKLADTGMSYYQAATSSDRTTINALYSDSLLTRYVWNPVIDALPQSASRIYFAPEGIFHLIGIENLPFSGRDSLELHRLSSPAVLIDRHKRKKISIGKTLVAGGLDYDEPAPAYPESITDSNHSAYNALARLPGAFGAIFGYLPGTRLEADSVAHIVGQGQRIGCLSEEQVKNELPGYTAAHLATHGYAFSYGLGRRPYFLADSLAIDQSMELTGIALTGANSMAAFEGRDDGLLSAREIAALHLDSLRFIVLSACQTGLGNIADEGPAGLVRALKISGVGTVMASLWSVSDHATAILMTELYRGLKRGQSPFHALRAAQRHLRTSPSTVTFRRFSPARMARSRETVIRELPPLDEPYFWAPFIIIDDF